MSAHAKIYTKTGDKGETALVGGSRIAKNSLPITAIGEVDELNAILGLVRAENKNEKVEEILQRVQNDLFELGADLATPSERKPLTPRMSMKSVAVLERWIDEIDAKLEPLQNFILPGGTRAAALFHQARAVCRRAERSCVSLRVRPEILAYVNRLSDLLFVLARYANFLEGMAEEKWVPRK